MPAFSTRSRDPGWLKRAMPHTSLCLARSRASGKAICPAGPVPRMRFPRSSAIEPSHPRAEHVGGVHGVEVLAPLHDLPAARAHQEVVDVGIDAPVHVLAVRLGL